MRKRHFLVILVFLVVSAIQGIAIAGEPDNKDSVVKYNWRNAKYMEFDDFNEWFSEEKSLSNIDLVWQKKEIKRWKAAIKKAAALFPEDIFKITGPISWGFCIDRTLWVTGRAFRSSSPFILINLASCFEGSCVPNWMTWEPLNKDGYSEAEMVFVAIHEIAHIYSRGNYEFQDIIYLDYYSQSSGMAWWNNNRLEAISLIHCWDSGGSLGGDFDRNHQKVHSGFIKYGGVSFKVKGGDVCHIHEFELPDESRQFMIEYCPTLYGCEQGLEEDFADTVALYLMWPESLKASPLHYNAIKNIPSMAGREYKSTYPMPNSIKTRLVAK